MACGGGAGRRHQTAGSNVVDSVRPMAVALDRFRDGLPAPGGLHGGFRSREALVRQVVRALERRDTTAFERLAVNRAEWAWLFYPTNVLSLPPYELPPVLAWFQLQERNRKSVFRALRELGGRELGYRGYRCDPDPTVEGENRIWSRCVVTLALAVGPATEVRLFGAILEREGRFLVLSYANDY